MDNQRKENKIIIILKFCLLLIIVIGVPLLLYVTHSDVINGLNRRENIQEIVDYLTKYKTESYFVYIGLQIIQIVISILPGQIFQMAAGYLYGFFLGLFLSIIGAALGSAIAYYIAHCLGKDAVKLFAKEETVNHWLIRLNSKRAYIIVFLLYLIPGLPKDVIAYAAGISQMKIKAFLVLSLLGRLPAMAASIAFGAFYESEQYYLAGGVAIVSIVIFIICLIKRKSISTYIDKFYVRLSK